MNKQSMYYCNSRYMRDTSKIMNVIRKDTFNL